MTAHELGQKWDKNEADLRQTWNWPETIIWAQKMKIEIFRQVKTAHMHRDYDPFSSCQKRNGNRNGKRYQNQN